MSNQIKDDLSLIQHELQDVIWGVEHITFELDMLVKRLDDIQYRLDNLLPWKDNEEITDLVD